METTGRGARLRGALSVGGLFLAAGSLCLTRATDADLGWHLATGDLIRRTGRIPRSDPFSYTVPGTRWIDIHWLFQVVASFVYEKGGHAALAALKTILILALFALLFRRGRRVAGTSLVVAALLLAVVACQERFLTRPEIVSWLFLALTLGWIDRALAAGAPRERRRILWCALPLLAAVWVNVQGLFMLAPAMVLLALLTALAGWRAPGGRDRAHDALVSLALVSSACLLNPYGAKALRLPFDQLFLHLGGKTLLSRTIAEFRPPLSGYLVTPAIAAFVALAALTALAILADARGVGAFDLLSTLATLYLALKARRNIPIFAITAVPVLLKSAPAALARLAERLPRAVRDRTAGPRRAAWSSAALSACALVLTWTVVTDRFFLHPPTERWWGVGPIPHYFPEEAARFVETAGIPGQIFHPLASGGFLMHAWKGERKVFIDGRNDPYLDGVLESYLAAIADPSAFEEAARRYQITAVLWPHQQALEAKPLLSYLGGGNGWTLVHLDPGAAVYLRVDLPMTELLKEAPFRPGRDRREVYEDLLRGLEARPFGGPPIREIALAEYFSVTDDPAGAEVFFKRALDRLPLTSAPLWHDEALALDRLGRKEEARAAHEAALRIDPRFLPSLAALGAALLDEGKVDEAERRIDAAYRGGERGAVLMTARARLLDLKGRPPEAAETLREALRTAPRNTGLLREIGAFYTRHDDLEVALTFYSKASEIDPGDPHTARAMALLLSRLGREAAALDVVRDAAGRALDAIGQGRPGHDEDRQIVLLAARLELRSDHRERAAAWLADLSRVGLLREEDLKGDRALRALAGPAAAPSGP